MACKNRDVVEGAACKSKGRGTKHCKKPKVLAETYICITMYYIHSVCERSEGSEKLRGRLSKQAVCQTRAGSCRKLHQGAFPGMQSSSDVSKLVFPYTPLEADNSNEVRGSTVLICGWIKGNQLLLRLEGIHLTNQDALTGTVDSI